MGQKGKQPQNKTNKYYHYDKITFDIPANCSFSLSSLCLTGNSSYSAVFVRIERRDGMSLEEPVDFVVVEGKKKSKKKV